MAEQAKKRQAFNVMIVGQAGRLQYEAVLFAASLRHSDPDFAGRLIVAEPQPGPLWNQNPSIQQHDVRALLEELGAEIIPFENKLFGQSYMPGNKIEALSILPEGEPFVFFDSDTLITGPLSQVPFDFDRPSASMRREDTWPVPELYGPGYHGIWQALYDKFGLDMAPPSTTTSQRNTGSGSCISTQAGFFHRCPREFGQRFAEYAVAIRDDPPVELVCQQLFPWLDQIALPLVIHSLGGARHTIPEGLLDGDISCHYRVFPMLYARESDRVVDVLETVTAANKIKKVLKGHDPIKRMIFQRRGHRVRALFDRENLPRREQMIRNKIKREKLWMR